MARKFTQPRLSDQLLMISFRSSGNTPLHVVVRENGEDKERGGEEGNGQSSIRSKSHDFVVFLPCGNK